MLSNGSFRGTFATIDLAALARNFGRLARTVAPARVLAVVKADGYGHGSTPVARALVAAGAWGLGVTTVEEAIALRDAGLRGPLLVLGGTFEGAYRDALEADLTPVVGRPEDARAFAEAARALGRRAALHVKVDTGMSRLGARPEDLDTLLEACDAPELELAGLMTHLATADAAELADAEAQMRRFDECLAAVRAAGKAPATIHAANTAAALRIPSARRDLVRLGIGLYGARPSSSVPDIGLEPVLAVTTRVVALRRIARGDAVGYGSRWRAQRPSTIATLPVGYGDGYLRRLWGRAEVLVGGRRAPVVGAISMDLTMIDVTDIPVAHGDEVVLVGAQGGEKITVEELAAWGETIPYEILCGLARRVPRQYREGAA